MIKNGQTILALGLLLFIAGGCSNLFKSKNEKDNTNSNSEKKVERKEYTLKNATNSTELVNALRPMRQADKYIRKELLNPEKVESISKLYGNSVAEAKLKFSGGKNPISLRIIKFSSESDAMGELDNKNSYLKTQKKKPVKTGKKDIKTIIWVDNGYSHFFQCKSNFCFDASGIPESKKLVDSFAPLMVVSKFRNKI